jgi:hypothetical protein
VHNQHVAALADTVYSYQTHYNTFQSFSCANNELACYTLNQPCAAVADVGALAAYVAAAVEPVQLFDAVTKL